MTFSGAPRMRHELVKIHGAPSERGRQFGSQRAPSIALWLSAWLDSLRASGIEDPDRYLAMMMDETDFLPAIRQHTPELDDEVNAIAAGAKVPPQHLFAAQLMDEEWEYRRHYLASNRTQQKCSCLAIKAGLADATWIGQNMDLGAWTNGHQLLLEIAAHEHEAGVLLLTVGGLIGLIGINTSGIALCVNSLPQLPSARSGLPVAYLVRKILSATSLSDAADRIRTLPHATGQHYLIADSEEIRSFEASASGVAEYVSPNSHRFFHTNHPRVAKETRPLLAREQANTDARLLALERRLSTASPSLQLIVDALCSSDDADNPVCRPAPDANLTNTINFTTGSMVSKLLAGSSAIESWIAFGPPTSASYQSYVLARV